MHPDPWQLYRMMVSSRMLENGIADLWREGRISGEMHLGIGEEGIVAGVLAQLQEGDAIAADHRSTPPFVMLGVPMEAIVAECLGSEDGLGRGFGGHMHLLSRAHLAASSGIVGSAGPLACGFALAHQHLRPSHAAIAFFGEGAMNQGMLLESFNLAAVWNLPVVFVCKDNGMAISTRSRTVSAGDLPDRARSLGVPSHEVDGSDAEAVWHVAHDAVLRARRGGGPSYVHASCVRPEGHFLGDPLLRLVRSPGRELAARGGPLLRSLTQPSTTRLHSQLSSLGAVAATVGAAATMRGRDPVARLRTRLRTHGRECDRLEEETATTVRVAIDAAIRSVPPAT